MANGNSKLKLIRVLECTRFALRPALENDVNVAVFMHCTGGMASVFEDYFYRYIVPVFKLHNVEYEVIGKRKEIDQNGEH